MTAGDLIKLLARFTVTGLRGGSVMLTCTRCKTSETFDRYPLDDVALSDLAVWGRDHVCPEARTAPPRRELAAVS